MNLSDAPVALVPPGVVMVMSAAPAPPAGEVAVTEVALLTVKDVADVAPHFTAVAPVKCVPVMVTAVPPSVVPLLGEIAVTVGAGVT